MEKKDSPKLLLSGLIKARVDWCWGLVLMAGKQKVSNLHLIGMCNKLQSLGSKTA